MSLTWPPQAPNSTLDYRVNWQYELASGETITSSSWVLNSGSVTIGTGAQAPSFAPTYTTIWLSGGTLDEVNTLTNTIGTSTGATHTQVVLLKIAQTSALSQANVTTSNTYTVSPNLGQVMMAAFQRLQIRYTDIDQEKLSSGATEANLMQSSWAADGIIWWTVEQLSQPLTAAIASYTIPANVISVLDVFINDGTNNLMISPITRTNYASIVNLTQQGLPTCFWFDRALIPNINLWPTPSSSSYTMNYYAYSQTQDATFGNGAQPAVPNWWLDAYVAGLAHRLSRIWKPDMEAVRKVDAMEAYNIAIKQGEIAPMSVVPTLQSYFR